MAIQGTQLQKDNLDSMMTVVEKEWNKKTMRMRKKQGQWCIHYLQTGTLSTYMLQTPHYFVNCKFFSSMRQFKLMV